MNTVLKPPAGAEERVQKNEGAAQYNKATSLTTQPSSVADLTGLQTLSGELKGGGGLFVDKRKQSVHFRECLEGIALRYPVALTGPVSCVASICRWSGFAVDVYARTPRSSALAPSIPEGRSRASPLRDQGVIPRARVSGEKTTVAHGWSQQAIPGRQTAGSGDLVYWLACLSAYGTCETPALLRLAKPIKR